MKKIFQKINTSNISKRLQNTKQNFKDKINTVVTGKKSQKSDLQLYLEEATKQNGNIVPVKLLDTIVQYSYEGENIIEIVEFFATLIDRKIYSANSMIRALIVIEYLLKHGPSEFKEELFQYKDILDDLFNYKQGQNKDKQELIQKKSQFINRLLTEKQLLQKEKQIAMEIKHKMKQDQAQLRINSINSTQLFYNQQQMQSPPQISNNQSFSDSYSEQKNNKPKKMWLKLEDFVENYMFKYMDKVNDNIDEISTDINQTIEAYIEFIKIKYFKNSVQNSKEFVPESCIELEENEVEISIKDFKMKQNLQNQKNFSQKVTVDLDQQQELQKNQQQNINDNINQKPLQLTTNLLELEDNNIENDKEEIGKKQSSIYQTYYSSDDRQKENQNREERKKKQEQLYDIDLL